MSIGIIGTGHVRLVSGTCFAEFGVYATCIDKDEKKIRTLKKGEVLWVRHPSVYGSSNHEIQNKGVSHLRLALIIEETTHE